MGVVEGEEADRDRDTTRGRAEKEEPGGRGIIRIGGMQGNGRERNRKAPPHHLHLGESCARCKEQDRGWLCCQKNLAPFLPRLLPVSFPPTPLPSHVWLARKEGAALMLRYAESCSKPC